MRSKLGRPSHATVVAYLALFVALGGSAYAVNTVGSADVIDDSLTSADIKGRPASGGTPASPGTLTTYDIADGTIRFNDIATNQIGTGRVINESLTGDDIQNGSLKGADVDEFSLGPVPNAYAIDGHTADDLVKGGGEVIKDRSDLDPGTSEIIDVGLGRVQLQCNSSGQYALFYWQQSATTGGMDVFWKNLDGVGYQRNVNLGPAAQLTPFTTRADIVTVHAGWTADWTPSDLVVISVRFDATANQCVAIYRSIWSLN
jgi:hypothetical protein